MKKLKTWQKVLLIIFYPVGIVYFIFWLCNRNKTSAAGGESVIKDFYTKVVGVTFNNDNGSSRQEIIKNRTEGEQVILKPVPTKEFPDAIGVFTTDGQQLGHISAELAANIKNEFSNNRITATISNITGGGNNSYGCNLHIFIYSV